jgi:hypothetical protein
VTVRHIATMSNLFRLPRRRHLAQTHSYGVWTSSITVIAGKAHESWEGLWQVADRDGPLRVLFKSAIPLSAAGVKIWERKNAAAARHAMRAVDNGTYSSSLRQKR